MLLQKLSDPGSNIHIWRSSHWRWHLQFKTIQLLLRLNYQSVLHTSYFTVMHKIPHSFKNKALKKLLPQVPKAWEKLTDFTHFLTVFIPKLTPLFLEAELRSEINYSVLGSRTPNMAFYRSLICYISLKRVPSSIAGSLGIKIIITFILWH